MHDRSAMAACRGVCFLCNPGSPSPGKRAERPAASVAIGVTTDSQGMGPVNPEPSGARVPCPSAKHSRGEAVIGSAPASSSSASRRHPVTAVRKGDTEGETQRASRSIGLPIAKAKEPKLQRHLLFPGQSIEYEHQSPIRYVVVLQNT